MTTNPNISERRKFLLKLTTWVLNVLGIISGCILVGPFLMAFIMGGNAITEGHMHNSPIVDSLILILILLIMLSIPVSCFAAANFVRDKKSFKPVFWPILSLLCAIVTYYII